MSSKTICNRYASALFKLDSSNLDQSKMNLQQLQTVKSLFDQEDAGRVLRSPVMPVELKRDLLTYALKQAEASELISQFVYTILDAGRTGMLPDIIDSYELIIKDALGVLVANVTSFAKISDADQKRISEKLGKLFNKDVEVKNDVSKDVLGGFVIKLGNYQVDMSLKSFLNNWVQGSLSH